MRFVVVLVLVVAASTGGCTTDPPSTVTWRVHNDSNATIHYVVTLEGGAVPHSNTGTLAPGATDRHEVIVNGRDLTATVAIKDRDRDSAGLPFAVLDACEYQVDAVWDGQTWSVDASPLLCP